MKLIVVTGLSGAGKTQAIRCLEDFGYYCMDNIPPDLIPKFIELCYKTNGKLEKIAVVVDVRGGIFFDNLLNSLKNHKELGYSYEILYLEASDEKIIRRYKETRRNHPLARHGRILNAVQQERKMLSEIKNIANHVIDTSNMSGRQLKEEMGRLFSNGEESNNFSINVVSFGFKYGIPLDADLVFDVRFLPNPFYVKELKEFSGNDLSVRDFVMKYEVTKKFIEKLNEMLNFLIPNYISEGKSQLNIAIGCTGGRHRSVAISNEIYENLKEKDYSVFINHRDLIEDVMGDVK